MIPTLSIVFMAISALVSIGLPIALGIIWHKRTGAKASSLFIGAAAFVVFAMILENICHRLVLYGSGSCAAFMQSNLWAYGLYPHSKGAEALIADVREKIERAKREMADTIEKVKLIDREAARESEDREA